MTTRVFAAIGIIVLLFFFIREIYRDIFKIYIFVNRIKQKPLSNYDTLSIWDGMYELKRAKKSMYKLVANENHFEDVIENNTIYISRKKTVIHAKVYCGLIADSWVFEIPALKIRVSDKDKGQARLKFFQSIVDLNDQIIQNKRNIYKSLSREWRKV